jgi:hypothetical protein
MAELPKPEEVVAALASFPPKLSVLVKALTVPEDLFESTVRSATGVEVPAGPHKVLAELMRSFETSLPATAPPAVGGGKEEEEAGTVTKPSRFEIV